MHNSSVVLSREVECDDIFGELAICFVAEGAEGSKEDNHDDHDSSQKTEEIFWLFHRSTEIQDDAIALEVENRDAEEIRQTEETEENYFSISMMLLYFYVVLVEDDP